MTGALKKPARQGAGGESADTGFGTVFPTRAEIATMGPTERRWNQRLLAERGKDCPDQVAVDNDGVRRLQPLTLEGLTPAIVDSELPQLATVDPALLSVDPKYQRGLSRNSTRLVRRIVENWDWCAFKPPIVARADDRLYVVDGQHTAIAALTHGGFERIPVLVLPEADTQRLAAAFVKHNRDRVNVTPGQVHFANVAAGDIEAVRVQRICEETGVRLLKLPAAKAQYREGDCIAVGALQKIAANRNDRQLGQLLTVCRTIRAAPISASVMKAIDAMLFSPDYAGRITVEDIQYAWLLRAERIQTEARMFAADNKVPIWRGLVEVMIRTTQVRA